jgi:hypothetical protein
MGKAWKARLIGGIALTTLMVAGSWYFSYESLACKNTEDPPPAAHLNVYRPCMVNGVAGVASFLIAMPNTYNTTWQKGLEWVIGMAHPFEVSGNTHYRWVSFQGDDTSDVVVVRQHAGIGGVFADAFSEVTDSAKYWEWAKRAAKYLMIHETTTSPACTVYMVMYKKYDAVLDSMVYWHYKDTLGYFRGGLITITMRVFQPLAFSS